MSQVINTLLTKLYDDKEQLHEKEMVISFMRRREWDKEERRNRRTR